MNQLLSNKIIASIVALALLVGVGVLISSGDTSSTTRNAALVAAKSCTKPGQVTKVSKQSVVCAALKPKNIWYPIFKEKKWICAKLGITRKQNGIFSVCGKNKSSKKRWFLTKPLMAKSNPGLPTTEQEAFIKLTKNPEFIVETSPTTPITPAATTGTTIAARTGTTIAATTETTPAATTETTPAATTGTTLTPTTTTSTPSTTTTSTPSTPSTPSTTTTTTPKTCAEGGTCDLRDIGPGGGIVFYVAPTTFTCGEDLNATPATNCKYLEAAIAKGTATSTWTPTALTAWACFGTDVMTDDQRTASLEIGRGRANTKMITTKGCLGTDQEGNAISDVPSAASIAAAYNGGGKTDWFLPSRKELDALCHEFFKGGTGLTRSGSWNSIDNCKGSGNGDPVSGTTNGISWSFAVGIYWSSSEALNGGAWEQYFNNGSQVPYAKYHTIFVHPVRAFK